MFGITQERKNDMNPVNGRPRRTAGWLAAAVGAAMPSVMDRCVMERNHLAAQEACCFEPAYRLQCETAYEPRTETVYRTVWDTVPEERQVTETRMVLKFKTEEREYTVARPVVKTSYREEQYTVSTPVLETSVREETKTRTKWVTETNEYEQQVTSYRPIVETRMQVRQYQVQRPVTETGYQTQSYTAMRPVTTVQNQVVDAGGYVAQQVVTPGTVGYGLQWVPRAYQTTGPFGLLSVNRGGLFWTPQATPPTVQTQLAYRPNYVTQQVAQTQYVPETVQQQVPVQYTRMVNETVSEQVPVQVTSMQPVTETRRVPVTVQRPVTETYSEQVPVQSYRWVTETKTRRVPVTMTETVYETRKEPVQVQYYEPEQVVRKYTVNKLVPRVEAYQRQVMVARPVIERVVPAYYDAFGASIIGGHSVLMPPSTPAPIVVPGTSSVLESAPASESSQKPKTTLESVDPNAGSDAGEESPSDADSAAGDENGTIDLGAPSDQNEVRQPELKEPENASPTATRQSPFPARSPRDA